MTRKDRHSDLEPMIPHRKGTFCSNDQHISSWQYRRRRRPWIFAPRDIDWLALFLLPNFSRQHRVVQCAEV